MIRTSTGVWMVAGLVAGASALVSAPRIAERAPARDWAGTEAKPSSALLVQEEVTSAAEASTKAETIAWSKKLNNAIRMAAERSAGGAKVSDSELERATRAVRTRLVRSPWCYSTDMTEEQLATVISNHLMRPPGLEGHFSDRFVSDYNATDPQASLVWVGEGLLQPRGQGQRANLTYSFPNDSTTWGVSGSGFPPASNVLGASLVNTFGAGNLDRGREYIRQSLAAWKKYGGVNYTEVGDDNTSMSTFNGRTATRGDIRIGGIALGTNGVLAYNAFPTTAGLGLIAGGDMCINTSYFITNNFNSTTNDYRYFRNTVTHEHGHGLGYIHVVPCNFSKIMEPQISGTTPGMSVDERRGIAYNYGDRFTPNQSFGTAADFGNLTSPSLRSVIERDLAVNMQSAPANSGEDYFRFTLSSTQTVTISIDPTGGSYQNDQQNTGCSGMLGNPAPTINADEAGNLSLSLLNSSQAIIGTANLNAAGVTESITQSLPAGTYTIRVSNEGNANPSETDPNKLVQLYDLEVRVATAFAPPWAVAGVNKRVQANTVCWFNSINSQANETGATIPPAGYAWDLDGDGLFESAGNARPSMTYVSNGTYNVALRITDSNGVQDTDNISVTVFGAAGSVDAVTPNSGQRNSIVPITIEGKNFKGVTMANQVTLQGSGVTASGTPVVNALGTTITGLSLIISNTATLGARNMQITNADGQSSVVFGTGVFTVTAVGSPTNDECSAPTSWGNTAGTKNFTNANATNSGNQSFPSTGCPGSGPINNDVWYSWTSPSTGTLTVTNNSQSQGFDSRIAVYSGTCPPSGTLLGCDDFNAPIVAQVTAGSSYLFRVGSATSGQTGNATVTLSVIVPSGACCTGTTCTVTTPAACASASGTYQGDNTACGSFSNPTTCCRANVNQTGGVTADDIFAFLDLWFAQNGATGPGFGADFNKDNQVNADDIFAFLDAWFLGC